MDRTEYINSLKDIEERREYLSLTSQRLEREYIEENSAIEVGQEITICGHKTKVYNITSNDKGDFSYELDDSIIVDEDFMIKQGYKTRKTYRLWM